MEQKRADTLWILVRLKRVVCNFQNNTYTIYLVREYLTVCPSRFKVGRDAYLHLYTRQTQIPERSSVIALLTGWGIYTSAEPPNRLFCRLVPSAHSVCFFSFGFSKTDATTAALVSVLYIVWRGEEHEGLADRSSDCLTSARARSRNLVLACARRGDADQRIAFLERDGCRSLTDQTTVYPYSIPVTAADLPHPLYQ